jgi:hypothetical protein
MARENYKFEKRRRELDKKKKKEAKRAKKRQKKEEEELQEESGISGDQNAEGTEPVVADGNEEDQDDSVDSAE